MTTATALDFGPATHLTCRACGEQYPLGAAYACMECFGPLEVGYEIVAPTREEIAAGPPNIWRYRALLPVPGNIADLPEGATVAVPNDSSNLGRALKMLDEAGVITLAEGVDPYVATLDDIADT